MSEWTKVDEPCCVAVYESGDELKAVNTASGKPVAELMYPIDAERFVALWNAFLGIPTDKLAAHVAAVERLREAAREALELAAEGLSYTPTYVVEKYGLQKRHDELAAALAAMEGSK